MYNTNCILENKGPISFRWGDVSLKQSSDGLEYLELQERQTKTRTGADLNNIREVAPKIFATPEDPERCPVQTYKLYSAKRPDDFCEPNHPFYIAPRTSSQTLSASKWFMKAMVGEKKIGGLLKAMAVDGGLDANKRLTNHSCRKHLVQKLRDAGIAPTDIMQISGHKSIHSVLTYSAMSEGKHKECSRILSSRPKPASTVTCLGDNEPANPIPSEKVSVPKNSAGQKHDNLDLVPARTSSSQISLVSSASQNTCGNLPHPAPRDVENPFLINQDNVTMNTMNSVFSGAVLNIQNCNMYFNK